MPNQVGETRQGKAGVGFDFGKGMRKQRHVTEKPFVWLRSVRLCSHDYCNPISATAEADATYTRRGKRCGETGDERHEAVRGSAILGGIILSGGAQKTEGSRRSPSCCGRLGQL